MRSNKDRKLNLGTAFRLTIRNQFVKKNLDVKIHKLCNLADTEEIQCTAAKMTHPKYLTYEKKGKDVFFLSMFYVTTLSQCA